MSADDRVEPPHGEDASNEESGRRGFPELLKQTLESARSYFATAQAEVRDAVRAGSITNGNGSCRTIPTWVSPASSPH